MFIKVTQEDINNGKYGNFGWCPIALALRRKYPDASVCVGSELASISTFPDTITGIATKYYNLSIGARKFIQDFDNRRQVKPSWFLLW